MDWAEVGRCEDKAGGIEVEARDKGYVGIRVGGNFLDIVEEALVVERSGRHPGVGWAESREGEVLL